MLKKWFSSASNKSVARSLGPLEQKVLEQVWKREKVSVRDVFLALDQSWAYTTLLTTMERLFKKGLLQREKDGKAFLYRASITPQELASSHLSGTIDDLLESNAASVSPILATIIDKVSEYDRAMLDELDRLIQEKRCALQNQSEGENV